MNHKRQVNEKWLSDYGSAKWQQFKDKFKAQPTDVVSAEHRLGKQKFIEKFLSSAYSTLDSEIQSGRVDPSIKGTQNTAPATPATSSSATVPAQPSQPPKTPTATNGSVPDAAQKQASQNLNNYIKNIASTLNSEPDKNKKMALAKEVVNFMADRKGYPEWQNAVATVQQVLKRNIADPNFYNSAVTKLKAGQTISESWQIYWINKLLESTGITWKSLGLVLLKESANSDQYVIADAKYYKLNRLFESIILTEAESIGQFFTRWLPKYMKDIPMNDPHTKELIKKIEDTYSVDKGRAALTQLANAAYASNYAPGYGRTEPTRAPAAPTPAQTQSSNSAASTTQATNQPNASGTSASKLAASIQNNLRSLKQVDPAMYSQLVKSISPASTVVQPSSSTKPSVSQATTRPSPSATTRLPTTSTNARSSYSAPRPGTR